MSRRLAATMRVALTVQGSPAAWADQAFVDLFQSHLAAADLDGAEALAFDRVTADPADAQARFALGTAQFLQAVEGLGADLYAHGLEGHGGWDDDEIGITMLPFLRMPVSLNPDPQPFTPEVLRQILSDFDAALLRSEATLAAMPEGPVRLPLDVRGISLDYDRDGKADGNETIETLIHAVSGTRLRPDFPVIGFDESDVTWLRGYAHLLAGVTDIILAHDFSETVELTFQAAFPDADLVSAPLNEHYEVTVETSGIGDLVAFIHLFRWPVVEPDRLLVARRHFLSMIALSRESWASILAETDDDAEWVPGPKQTGLFRNLRVNDQVVAGWMEFLDQAEGVLEGRLLLAHWRFGRNQGVNLRRMFEEPRTLDPVMILTGAGAIPYLEKGELAAGSTMDTAMGILDGGFLAYFLWFN